MHESIYEDKYGVKITKSLISDGNGKTYQLRNINSVSTLVHTIPWIRSLIKTALLEMFLCIFGSTILLTNINLKQEIQLLAAISIILISIGGIIFHAYKNYKKPKQYFSVLLSTSSGEIESFIRYEEADVHQIANAINQAISESVDAA